MPASTTDALTLIGNAAAERKAWTAMAELFLDTSFDDHDRSRIAATLRATAIDTRRLDDMFRRDLAPAFAFNLLSIAGEWIPWDETEVLRTVAHARRTRAFAKLRNAMKRCLVLPLVEHEWRRILDQV